MVALKPFIRVQREDFDLQTEIAMLTEGRQDIGAVVTFTGLCRDEGGSLNALELEHYPGMAEAEMARIAELAIARFSLLGLSAVHRYGKIAPARISCWSLPPHLIGRQPSMVRISLWIF